VQLGREIGFELLEGMGNSQFQVVFVTAFSEYAVRAFRFRVADYLLKPIDRNELKEAIHRVRAAAVQPHLEGIRTFRIPAAGELYLFQPAKWFDWLQRVHIQKLP